MTVAGISHGRKNTVKTLDMTVVNGLNHTFNICECFLTPTMFPAANHLFKITLEHMQHLSHVYESYYQVITES